MRKFSKFFAAIAASVVAFASVCPVLAEGITYTGVAGGTPKIQKYLIMDENANVPNVTFNFSIAPGEGVDSSDPATKLQVRAGLAGATIGNATFAQGQDTYTTPQAIDAADGIQAQGLSDNVELQSGEKYARSAVEVDFSGVTFVEPGIYRYIITETASDTTKGIVDDADATRYMDVYVIDNGSGVLSVQGYVLHDSDTDATMNKDGSMPTDFMKASSFVNRYISHDLVIEKEVAGNQASHDEYFKFTVVISNALAGTVYTVDLSDADATTKTNTSNTDNGTAHTNPATLTVGTDGTVTAEFWLQGGQSVAIKGLANNTAYTITEDDALLDKEAYVTSCAQVGDTDGTFTADSRQLVNEGITADTTDTFTNEKSGTIPTGILVKTLPAICLMGFAAVLFVASRKSKEEEF